MLGYEVISRGPVTLRFSYADSCCRFIKCELHEQVDDFVKLKYRRHSSVCVKLVKDAIDAGYRPVGRISSG
jgi:hypothetical protein